MDGITDSMDLSLSKLWEIVKERENLHAVVYGVTKSSMGFSVVVANRDYSVAVV